MTPARLGRLRKVEPHLGGRMHRWAPASCGRFPTGSEPGCWRRWPTGRPPPPGRPGRSARRSG
eukprot:8506400-Alexandrium_andersonii.AAC.1